MACRVRFLHLILLGLVGMSLVIYSSYFATVGPPSPPPPPPAPPEAPLPPLPPAPPAPPVAESLTNDGKHQVASLSKTSGALADGSGSVPDPQSSGNSSNIPPDDPASLVAAKSNVSTSSPSSLSTSAAVVAVAAVAAVAVDDKQNSIFHIQHIPAPPGKVMQAGEVTATAVGAAPADSTEKGVSMQSMYQDGYTIANAGLCPNGGSTTQLVVLVTSAPDHAAARMAIRQTWGHFSQRSDLNIAFFLGTTRDDALRHEIDKEAALYGDIIYANFLDSYDNLTLKTVSMLEWVDTYCNRTKFFLKTDDDMFINVPVLLNFIEKHSKFQKCIFGRLAKKWKPVRIKKSKYYVSPEQYKPVLFPNFTTGPAYLVTGDAIKDLYRTALEKTYLKLEDVFITGIVAQDVKIKRVHVNEFFNKRITFNPCNVLKGISIHMIKFHEQFDLWKRLLDGRSKCP